MKFLITFVLAAVLMAMAIEAKFTCPTESGYYPHENCRFFYQCSNGNAYEMPCAPGTKWNQTLLTCDHDDGNDCNAVPEEPASTAEPIEEPTEAPEDSTTQAPEEPTTTTTNAPDAFKCPAPFGNFPHPQVCWKFIRCLNWKPHVVSCPPFTGFSSKIRHCTFQWNCRRSIF